MTTKQQIIDRAMQLATNTGGDSSRSVVVDNEATAFVAFPNAVRAVAARYAGSGRSLEDLIMSHDVEIAQASRAGDSIGSFCLINTWGTLPATVIRRFLDRSRLPEIEFSSLEQYTDYMRYRFDQQLAYYATRDSRIYYSRDVAKLRDVTGLTATSTLTSDTVLMSDTAVDTIDDVARRIRITRDSDSTVVIDAFVASLSNSSTIQFYGRPLQILTGGAVTLTLFDETRYQPVRSLTNATTTAGSRTVGSTDGAFTAADLGRRIRVVSSGVVKLDAIIAKINSSTSVTCYAAATGTATGTAAVSYARLLLDAPGLPLLDVDADAELTLSPALADDAAITIAAVIKGEIKLADLVSEADSL